MAQILADFVIESSTTTGTGDISVTGALNGLRRFRDKCSVGDKLRYIIKAVDGNGVPTGQFEIVKGTYSALDTLTRDTVIDSSNAGALVNFSAGAKQVYMGLDAGVVAWVRERLFAARTYYVRSDGNDNNDGLANTSGGAFLTVQKAIDVASGLDNGGYDITIRIGTGTFTATNTLKSFIGSGRIVIRGNASDMTSTVISTTSSNCFTGSSHVGVYHLEYMKLQTTTSGVCIGAVGGGKITWGNIDFGACASYHVYGESSAYLSAAANYTVSGSAIAHYAAYDLCHIRAQSITVTVSGTPAFSGAFASAGRLGNIVATSITFSGSATGKRYDSTMNAVINSGGGGASYFPGGTSGTTATGGLYA